MTRTRNNIGALCFMAFLAMSTTITSCRAAGRNIAAKGCAPTAQPNNDVVCKLYCKSLDYDMDVSYCTPDNGGTCCCLKK
ncbi:unnamed protein product [Alopecurus aequalis]